MQTLLLGICLLFTVSSQAQARLYDIIIDEIMADPTPSVGLPDAEFIELKNVSPVPYNLNGWRLSDATGTATINVNFTLQPDSFVVICSSASAPLLAVYGTVLPVSNFPSLSNDGELLSLRSKEGRLIHAVEYSKSWYQNAVKAEGGWTLEMIDTKNPCTGAANWRASIQLNGGTPGKKNSIDAVNKDMLPPLLMSAFAADSSSVVLMFNEPLDSALAANTSNYIISEGLASPRSALAVAPLFNRVDLRLATPLQKDRVYSLTVKGIRDCSGNLVNADIPAQFGLASMADTFDLVINEILFNPRPNGADYLEIYNRSKHIINMKDVYAGNRSSGGQVGALRQLSTDNYALLPGAYIVITENAEAVKQQYLIKNPAVFLQPGPLPSWPDDKGTAVLLNSRGVILDELSYDEKWQFALIQNDEGVALERVDYNKPTQDQKNWHSAGSSAGYGTPGYQNSQYTTPDAAEGQLTIKPEVFSPDNDGLDDFATINYEFSEPGYVCNITIFDANGRPVRHLVRNAVCGLKGYFRWDGLDEKNNKLNIGVYVIFTEVFTLQGKTKRFKHAIVLARQLR